LPLRTSSKASNDALVLSRNVSVYNTDGSMMERTNNTIYRPQPYIAQSYDGMDQTGNFTAYTQLSVPATLGFQKSVPFILDALELRDALQEGRLGDAAKQKLASDINIAIMNVAAAQGSLVVTVNTAAGDYDDIALCDTIMNEQGVQAFDRYMALSSATTTASLATSLVALVVHLCLAASQAASRTTLSSARSSAWLQASTPTSWTTQTASRLALVQTRR
jgi:hypothetical protein